MTTKEILEKVVGLLEQDDGEARKEAVRILKDFLKITANGQEYRIKFGKNPYTDEHKCSYKKCGQDFSRGGFWVRLERYSDGKFVDIPICQETLDEGHLLEGTFTFEDKEVKLGLA